MKDLAEALALVLDGLEPLEAERAPIGDAAGRVAAGDVRSGSLKRCATAVGEGSMAVQLVHEHLASEPAGVS